MRSAFSPPSQPTSTDPFAALGTQSFPKPLPAAPPPVVAKNEDEEWSFSSALPPEAVAPPQPREYRAVVSNTSIKIDVAASRGGNTDPSIHLLFVFTNNTASPVSDLHFQLAVTKVSIYPDELLTHVTNMVNTTGLRTPASAADRPEPGAKTKPRRDAVYQGVALWRQDEKGRGRQAPVESGVQSSWGFEE